MNHKVLRTAFSFLAIVILGFCLSTQSVQGAAKLTTLISFGTAEINAGINGSMGPLIQGRDNHFYGTSYDGTNGGTVFRMAPNGALTVWTPFTQEGFNPASGLVEGTDGDFYGTTSTTLIHTNGAGYHTNWGTVFKITTNGLLTTLASFNGSNGAHPEGELIQAMDGYFYGTTSRGGVSNLGTVFRMSPEGEMTTLLSFSGFDGAVPRTGLTLGPDENLYGTTSSGGDDFHFFGDLFPGGWGTVFKITTNGTLTTLISFSPFQYPYTGGYNPIGALLLGQDGDFYGTTFYGGTNYSGTIFRITTDGTYTEIFSFSETNGAYPRCKLAQFTDGTLYGTTQMGGPGTNEFGGAGTIFRITTGGVFTNLHSFKYDANGYWPMAGLTLGADGKFYGITTFNGAIFRLEDFSDPFPAVKGEFAGLFQEQSGVRHESSGYFAAKVTERGKYSAKLLNNGKAFKFSGRFDAKGQATNDIVRHGINPLHVELHLDLVNGTDQITGSVHNGNWTADLLAHRLVFSKRNPSPRTGKHTFVIFSKWPPLDAPDGDGFATISVQANGGLRMQGVLADATPMSQRTLLSKEGMWPLYVPLYRGKGSILCWVRFSIEDNTDDYLSWFKPPIPNARYYPEGFMAQCRLICAPYNSTNRSDPVFEFTDGRIYFGSWSGPFDNTVILGPGNLVRNTGGNPMTLTINKSNGRFTGTVVEPYHGKRVPFRGVVLEGTSGYGHLLDSGLSGRVEIGQ